MRSFEATAEDIKENRLIEGEKQAKMRWRINMPEMRKGEDNWLLYKIFMEMTFLTFIRMNETLVISDQL